MRENVEARHHAGLEEVMKRAKTVPRGLRCPEALDAAVSKAARAAGVTWSEVAIGIIADAVREGRLTVAPGKVAGVRYLPQGPRPMAGQGHATHADGAGAPTAKEALTPPTQGGKGSGPALQASTPPPPHTPTKPHLPAARSVKRKGRDRIGRVA